MTLNPDADRGLVGLVPMFATIDGKCPKDGTPLRATANPNKLYCAPCGHVWPPNPARRVQ